MEKITNILIVGVGGQGILTASRVISNLALSEGYDVKTSEIHGMSQRGGSVERRYIHLSSINTAVISYCRLN